MERMKCYRMKQIPYRLAEALKCICKKKSLETITVSEIAAEAGVTRQVFYHYFTDKFELASWIHCVHLYQSVKSALEEDSQQMWRLTTEYWLKRLENNKTFYINAFQSVSQKEFQRIIRDFFFHAYCWQMEQHMQRELNQEERFVLHLYLFGGMEEIYEWIAKGMPIPAEQMVLLLEAAMPELIGKWILTGKGVTYEAALKKMEEYLLEEGLLQAIS